MTYYIYIGDPREWFDCYSEIYTGYFKLESIIFDMWFLYNGHDSPNNLKFY